MRASILSAVAASCAVLSFASVPAGAQEPVPAACAAVAAPPAELAAWSTPKPMQAAAHAGPSGGAALAVGQAARLTLSRTSDVHYPLRPEKPGAPASYGGFLAIDIAEAGTYRVALGTAAWVDMVRGGQAMTSIAHAHGPTCTGIRKIVDFALTPGRYTLQIARNGQPETTVLTARLP